MRLSYLSIESLRNIDQATLEPGTGLNLIVGRNGSGKTSLLEAIYLLGRGRSFRTPYTDKLIQTGRSRLLVRGRLTTKYRDYSVALQRQHKTTEIRLAGRSVRKASQLAAYLPIQVIEPSLHGLLEQGPENRRRFLEWGVFHVEHAYESLSQEYRRALNQRNAALRRGWGRREVVQWDGVLQQAAERITDYRRRYIKKINHYLGSFAHEHGIGFMEEINIDYTPGWSSQASYSEVLDRQFESDQTRGFTQSGPHRADIRIRHGDRNANDILSRGQKKLLVVLLYIAQASLLTETTDKRPVILVDDLSAELDTDSRTRVLDILVGTDTQVFLTATSTDQIPFSGRNDTPFSLFHVEHGQVEQVI